MNTPQKTVLITGGAAGRAQDIARSAIFLASDASAKSGQVLAIDGNTETLA